MKDKVYFARLYGVAEKDITPEFMPIFIALEQNSIANKELTDNIKGNIKSVVNNYPTNLNEKTAMALKWGWFKHATWIIVALCATFIAYLFINAFFLSKNKYAQNLIHYNLTTKEYYIDENDWIYDKKRKVIILK